MNVTLLEILLFMFFVLFIVIFTQANLFKQNDNRPLKKWSIIVQQNKFEKLIIDDVDPTVKRAFLMDIARAVPNKTRKEVTKKNYMTRNHLEKPTKEIDFPVFPGNLSGIIAFGEKEGTAQSLRVIMAAGSSRAKGLPQVITAAYYENGLVKSIGSYEFHDAEAYKYEQNKEK